MLKTRVIPCLTIKNERLVKSVRFAEHRNIGSYIAAVRVFNSRDVDELIFLDLDAARRGIRPDLLREVTKECFMPVTLGGGVRSLADFQTLLNCGADKVSINTAAIETPELITEAAHRFGSQCVVVSIDVRSGEDATARAKSAAARGAGEILLTSVEHDGMMEGYNLPLIEAVAKAVNIPIIANGGAGTPQHCVAAAKAGASAVAAASIFQYTQTTPQLIKIAFAESGIPARIV
jgi:imidazole glycerol-phosphate synthase subunit HisF